MSTAAATGKPRTVAASPQWRWPQAIEFVVYLAVCAVAAAVLFERVTRPPAGEERDFLAPLWTIAVGIVSNASCAILGCYLVLRRMSLLGDAISHAVLPGIVFGFLLSGTITGLPIFLGAMAIGVLTSASVHAVTSLGRVSEDTGLGIVFTSLFAWGVILIPPHADLDPNCVLYGDIVTAAIDPRTIGGITLPRPLITLVPTLAVVLLFVLVLWKELKLVAFDAPLAQAMGFRVNIVHYLLMAMVSAVTVASFESVGSILVVAMLIVPAATAALLSERLSGMMAWAVAIGATSAVFGYLVSVPLATSVAGSMAVVAGLQFALAVFLSPRSGLFSRWLRNRSLAVRIAAEDVLARLYRQEERGQGSGFRVQDSEKEVALHRPEVGGRTGLVGWLARRRMLRLGYVRYDRVGDWQLTESGRAAARSLVRAHRLWESYLDTHFDLPRDHLHEAAEHMEHFLGSELQRELAAELADRATDPHGKAIPPSPAR